jgi:two-component sensor histidine kinase
VTTDISESDAPKFGASKSDDVSSLAEQPRYGRARSLRLQIILLLCFAMGPTAALGIWQAFGAYERQTTVIRESLARDAAVAVRDQEQLILGAEKLLTAIAKQEAVRDIVMPACSETMKAALRDMPSYTNMMRLDASGQIVCLPSESEKFDDRAWFQAVKHGRGFVVSDVLVGRFSNEATVVAAVPVRGADGQFAGSLSLGIDLDTLNQPTASQNADPNMLAVLLDATGRPVMPPELIISVSGRLPEQLPPYTAADQKPHLFEAAGADGVKRLYVHTPIVADNVFVLYGQPTDNLFKEAERDLVMRILLPMAIWLLAVVTIWIGIERLVVRWVAYLARVAATYARGRYTIVPHRTESAPDEFRRLGEVLYNMAQLVKDREADLRQTLKQRNMLIREVHHRVKNNLQIVMSFLNLQTRRLTDPEQLGIFEETKNRITALSLLHQTLCESTDLEFINLRSFVTDLCAQMLKMTWRGDTSSIRFKIDIPELVVRTETATPLTLLLTEAVTNSLKHAFKRRSLGIIEIKLTRDSESTVLTIRDNGGGLPGDATAAQQGSIGLSLMGGFARQLGGTLEMISENGGTAVIISFPHETMDNWSAERAQAAQ